MCRTHQRNEVTLTVGKRFTVTYTRPLLEIQSKRWLFVHNSNRTLSGFLFVLRNFVFCLFLFLRYQRNKIEKKLMRWRQTTKWSGEIKIISTTRRFGKSAPPVLNDRQLIQEWLNHLFPIINILANVRFAPLARSLVHSVSQLLSVCMSARCHVALNTSRERI